MKRGEHQKKKRKASPIWDTGVDRGELVNSRRTMEEVRGKRLVTGKQREGSGLRKRKTDGERRDEGLRYGLEKGHMGKKNEVAHRRTLKPRDTLLTHWERIWG